MPSTVELSRKSLRAAALALPLLLASAIPVDGQANATAGVAYASTGFEGDNDGEDDSVGGRLLTIDLATGVATLVGSTGVEAMGGLAIDSQGRIFGTDPLSPSTLYRVDAATGVATPVGSTGIDGVDAIAFDDNDVLYAAESFAADELYTLDVESGAATLVGSFGLIDGESGDQILGLAFDPVTSTMFGSAGGDSDNIYTIDLATAQATLLGSTGLGGTVPDLLVDADGNLYASNGDNGRGGGGGGEGFTIGAPRPQATPTNFDLIAIDKTSGAGTLVGPTGFGSVSGLSFFAGGAAVDFTVDIDDLPDPVTAGSGAGNLTHTVTVYNGSPTDATNVTVNVTIAPPAGVTVDSVTPALGSWLSPIWTIPTLAANSSTTLTIVFTVGAATVPGPSAISVSAVVTGADQTIENPTDDSFSAQTSVLGAIPDDIPSLSAVGLAMLTLLLAGAALQLVRRRA